MQLHGGLPCTQHDVTNLLAEIDLARASARVRSEFAVLQATQDLRLQFILAGHYEDRFEFREPRWHLVERLEYWDLVGDLHKHLVSQAASESRIEGLV